MADGEMRLSPDAVHVLIVDALRRSETSPDNADAVARALVAAELAGQRGHGLRRVGSYAAQAACGKVDGHARPSLAQHKPAAALIDAANGFAYPAIEMAQNWLGETCPAQGIAIVGITRSHHCGVAGVVVEALADKGLVAMLFANTPGAMAPWGGRRALFGTNPIAFSAPVKGDDPVTVDISLSKVARGKIMAANQSGESIPEGWAFDADGVPTTDPAAALSGTMAPMGDAKGTVLALMVELLSAGLTGAHYSFEQSSFLNAQGDPPGAGQTLVAIDPTAFGHDATARFVHMAAKIGDDDGARLPGRRRQALREAFRRDGVPVDAGLVADIEAIGA
ncbi:Ldh family oxidoreductase [Hoeflea prorocentri]|uniref:Ldh family oxidoreductase n=1 Tax=Hoeflea prorocentri TaxID=1922333 RepID=A0A9X3UMX0_9HYPH|nr:Ldh family oxidoreductase [Hoeflea prorocentri]MCY6383574.1 Ldh family oxidoreductase [Hoeflea prorocentri]MDA5401374.1 Ldh family oxidoreductase [Hoeflea prorocentri]